jgi:AraC family transcriptional regulator of arabinose operon
MQRFFSNYDGMKVEWANRNVCSPGASFGQIRYQPGGYCGPRTQRDYELVLLYSGSCELRLDKSRRALDVGHVYLLRPGHIEHYLFDELNLTHHFWCSVAPSSLPPALKHSLNTVSDEGLIPSECFSKLVSSAFLVRPGQSSPACHVIDTLAICLFYEFLNMANSAIVLARDDTCVFRAVRYMEDHFSETDCLPGARRAAGCSSNALLYKFAQLLGTTPSRHLWRIRTEKGLELLADTGLSVAEIAERCGFKNPFHFSRCVRRMQGISPRELRRRAWA